jgi:hypothetical protein
MLSGQKCGGSINLIKEKATMKKIFGYSFILMLGLAFACNDNEDLLTEGAKEGGLLEPASLSLNYVVGNPAGPYTLEFLVLHGTNKTKEIRIYRSFVGTERYEEEVKEDSIVVRTHALTSNEVLDRTLTVESEKNGFIDTDFSLTQLIAGLTVKNHEGTEMSLPTDDGLYQIGDRWSFRVECVLEDGSVVQQAFRVNASVSTRYAGKYKAIAAEYYRIHVPTYGTSAWPAETVIESVDATTYRVVEYLGAAVFTGNEYYFQIIDGKITYPEKTPSGEAQTGNDQPFITCESNPADMNDVHCGTSNVVINDDVNGKDRLIMSFGYYTPGSGPRTFYQVLEKIN